MTTVVSTFIANAKIGFNMALNPSIWIGIATSIICLIVFLVKYWKAKAPDSEEKDSSDQKQANSSEPE